MRCVSDLALGQQLELLQILQFLIAGQVAEPADQHEPLIHAELDQIPVQLAQLKLGVATLVLDDRVRGHGADHHHKPRL